MNASICAVESAVIDWRVRRPGTGFAETDEVALRMSATTATAFMIAAALRPRLANTVTGQDPHRSLRLHSADYIYRDADTRSEDRQAGTSLCASPYARSDIRTIWIVLRGSIAGGTFRSAD